MPTKLVPVTGEVLTWAMTEAGMTRDDLANVLGVAAETVSDWEANVDSPTTGQFHKLAGTLGRPQSFFFLPRAPHKPPIPAAFRRFPEANAKINADELKSLRLAERAQKITQWVRERVVPGFEVKIPKIRTGSNPEVAALSVRDWLDWTLAEQVNADVTETSVNKAMRGKLQDNDVIVLHLPLGEDSVRGFSLPSAVAPLIAISTKDKNPARLFSYVHELSHLLIGDESFCLTRQNAGVERWCNQVAGAVLMPVADFREHVRRRMGSTPVSTVEEVSAIRRRYKVSLRACAVRLETLNLAQPGLFNLVNSVAEPKAGGGTYNPERAQIRPRVRLQQYGRGYINMLLDASDSGVMSQSQVLELLKISGRELTDLRAFAASGAEG